jgi:hypothetical protein
MKNVLFFDVWCSENIWLAENDSRLTINCHYMKENDL